MKAVNLLHLYRVRLRARLLQECLAVVGIAAGVALLFASQVSSASLQSSVSQFARGIVGNATLQLVARGPEGFPASVLTRVRQVDGVHVAAPLLEASANAVGPRGRESVELIGANSSLSALDGTLVRHTALTPFGGIGAVVIPAPLSRKLGVRKFGQEVTLQTGGHSAEAPLYEQLSTKQIGALIDSPVVVAPLFYAQEITGLTGRLSRILVQPVAGAQARVRAALEAIGAGRLNVETVDHEEKLFVKAAAVSNQATSLFAVISALVGFLFAFNAMLLTVPQRRRLIVDLRRDGYPPRTVIAVLLFDSVVLGLVACVLGLALGEELSIHLLGSSPAFLSLAFTVGSQRVVSAASIAIAVGGGMLAAIVAGLSPLPDILSRDPLAAVSTHEGAGGPGAGWRPALAGLVCLLGASALLLAAPDAAIPGMVLLLAALLLVLPIALSATLAVTRRVAAAITSVVPHVAVMELRAARARAVAITATGAIAVFGSVAIAGAHGDLLHGLENTSRDLTAGSDVWVAPAGAYNVLDTAPFTPVDRARLERLKDVSSVRLYRSVLLDYGERRLLVIAPPSQNIAGLVAAQLVQGDPRTVAERVRTGGWVVLSQAVAAEQHLHVGQALTLPTPDPLTVRLAGLSTNVGWAPGAIVMNASDYTSAWGSQEASAYDIVLAAGVSPAVGVRAIAHALPPNSGLAVKSVAQQIAAQHSLSHQALARLTEIAVLILIVSVLAMAAAVGAMVWQRRPRLAKLKLEGIPRAKLWHTILLESLLLLGVGCLTGAVFGLYGQRLADRALASAINFPVVYSITALGALGSLALVMATALAILAIPGYVAAGVPAALALQD